MLRTPPSEWPPQWGGRIPSHMRDLELRKPWVRRLRVAVDGHARTADGTFAVTIYGRVGIYWIDTTGRRWLDGGMTSRRGLISGASNSRSPRLTRHTIMELDRA